MLPASLALGIVLVVAADLYGATGGSQGKQQLQTQARPFHRGLNLTTRFRQEEQPSTEPYADDQLANYDRDYEDGQPPLPIGHVSGSIPIVELDTVDNKDAPNYQPPCDDSTSKPGRLLDGDKERSREDHVQTQGLSYLPPSKRLPKTSYMPALGKSWSTLESSVMKNNRKERRSHHQGSVKNERRVRLRRRTRKAGETRPSDHGRSSRSLLSPAASGQNGTVGNRTGQTQKSRILAGAEYAKTRRPIRSAFFTRNHSVTKRLARSKPVPSHPKQHSSVRAGQSEKTGRKSCSPCRIPSDLRKFHDGSCHGNASHCPWCNCPHKKSRCGIDNATCSEQCAYGWDGADCWLSVCPADKFGPYKNCSLSCEKGCEKSWTICHPISGECHPVADGVVLHVCPRKTFGKNCNSACHCLGDQTCHHRMGRCPESVCAKHYRGIVCQLPCPSYIKQRFVHVQLSLVVIIVLLKVILRLCKSKLYFKCFGDKNSPPNLK